MSEGMPEILERYTDGPAQLAAAVAGLSAAQLASAPAAGGWTICQIAHHIVDGDDIWGVAIKLALGNAQGVFSLPWYWEIPQDTWAECWGYADRTLGPSLALFRANRRHVRQLLERLPGAWERGAFLQWPDGQKRRYSVGEVVEMQTAHALGHVRDILAIREAHGLGEPGPATQYLYRIQPARPDMLTQGATPEEGEIIDAHFAYLQELAERGVVLLAGRTLNSDPGSFGIVLLRACSEEEARALMQGDPAVQQGVVRAELHPYRTELVGDVAVDR